MRILKFRSQPTIAFFAAVNHLILTDLLGNKTLLRGFKRSWFVNCGFRSVLCFSVSRFFLVIVIMIDGSEKHNCEGGFWSLESACLWKAQQSLSAVRGPRITREHGQLAVCFSVLLVFIQYNISVSCKSVPFVALYARRTTTIFTSN